MHSNGRMPRFGFLIDMDGVLYRGPELIPGADRFVRELRERDIPFRFLTNNSQRTRRDVVARLVRMGLEVEDEHVFTSAMATARFLAEWSESRRVGSPLRDWGTRLRLRDRGRAARGSADGAVRELSPSRA